MSICGVTIILYKPPDGGHAMFGIGGHPDVILPHFILYRGGALVFGQAEEGPLHEVLLVTGREVAGQSNE